MPGNAFIYLFDFIRCPAGNDPAAFPSATRPHVNDVIGILNYIKVMFNNHYGSAMINQSLKNMQQCPHILRMQSDCRFIKDKYRVALSFPHLTGKFQALCFTAGKTRCFLAKSQIAKS